MKQKWMPYKLAPDSDTEERFIIVDDTGEEEITGIIIKEEDARLIAAAPDLLEVCEYLRGLLTADDNWGIDRSVYLQALTSAIKKARGEA